MSLGTPFGRHSPAPAGLVVSGGIITPLPDDSNPFELDLDGFYERYLKTCAMSGVTPVSRERALGLVQEWSEVLSGRPEPTAH